MKHKETFTWAKKCILQENWIGASFVGNESLLRRPCKSRVLFCFDARAAVFPLVNLVRGNVEKKKRGLPSSTIQFSYAHNRTRVGSNWSLCTHKSSTLGPMYELWCIKVFWVMSLLSYECGHCQNLKLKFWHHGGLLMKSNLHLVTIGVTGN